MKTKYTDFLLLEEEIKNSDVETNDETKSQNDQSEIGSKEFDSAAFNAAYSKITNTLNVFWTNLAKSKSEGKPEESKPEIKEGEVDSPTIQKIKMVKTEPDFEKIQNEVRKMLSDDNGSIAKNKSIIKIKEDKRKNTQKITPQEKKDIEGDISELNDRIVQIQNFNDKLKKALELKAAQLGVKINLKTNSQPAPPVVQEPKGEVKTNEPEQQPDQQKTEIPEPKVEVNNKSKENIKKLKFVRSKDDTSHLLKKLKDYRFIPDAVKEIEDLLTKRGVPISKKQEVEPTNNKS